MALNIDGLTNFNQTPQKLADRHAMVMDVGVVALCALPAWLLTLACSCSYCIWLAVAVVAHACVFDPDLFVFALTVYAARSRRSRACVAIATACAGTTPRTP